MFDLFRSRARSVKILLGALMMLVALSMVITLIPGFGSGLGVSQPQIVAEIGGDALTIRDVQLNLQAMLRARQMPQELLPIMIPQMVDSMVNERVLAYQAERMGLRSTEQEVAQYIQTMVPQLFQDGKFVGRDIYAGFLAQQNMTIPEFESRVRQEIQINKLRRLAEEGIVVTDPEIEQAFRERNERVRLAYISVTPERLKDQANVSQDEVLAHFEQNRQAFQIPETRSADVLLVRQADIAQTITPSDQDLRAYYDQNRERFRLPERVQARHILLRTTGQSEEEIKKTEERMQEMLKQVRGGANFAELAQKHSEDPGSASRGGDLGFITRGQTVPAFEQAAFSLKPNEISDVIRTEYGFHIVQVTGREEAGLRPFEQVRDEIAEETRTQQVYQRMEAAADQIRAELVRNPQQAAEIAQRYPGVTHYHLENHRAGEPLPQLGAAGEIGQTLSGLGRGEVSQVIPVQAAGPDEGQAALGVAVVTDVRPARQAELAEVQDQVRSTLTDQRLTQAVDNRANQALARARETQDLQRVAKELNLEYSTTQDFTRLGAVDGIGAASYVSDAFTAQEGAILGPVAVGSQRVIYRVLQRTPAEMGELAEQREQLRSQLSQVKARQRMELFEESIRKQLQAEGKVTINEQAITSLVNSYRRG